MDYVTLTCNLGGGGSVTFDVSDTTSEDTVETFTLYDYYTTVIGS